VFGNFVENNRQKYIQYKWSIYRKFVTGQSKYILSQKRSKNMNKCSYNSLRGCMQFNI